MRSNMLNRQSLLLVIVVAVLLAATISILPRLGGNNSAQAQGLTLQGAYAFYTIGGSPVEAALGRLQADGMGNFTAGTITLNLPRAALFPGTTGRTSIQIAVTGGTYGINPDGTGFASAMITLPGQAPQPRDYDLLVTGSNGNIVTEAYLAQQQPTTGATVFANALGYYRITRVSD
ncbi:MAG: hypothetical protein HY314_01530 [Acidobacteria bacterium]|nr:hypothetical protein [Acidobacteriota bacterium]